MEQRPRAELRLGYGGWVRFMRSDLPAAVYLRHEDRKGRLMPVELYLEPLGDNPVDSDLLRAVPSGVIDRWVNAHAESIRSRLPFAGPDLRGAARQFETVFDRREEPAPLTPLEGVEPPELDGHVDVPPAKPYPDDFYREVADVYRRLARWSRGPAQLIADDNRVPVTTAHRWIKIARQKGFLEPARPTKQADDGER